MIASCVEIQPAAFEAFVARALAVFGDTELTRGELVGLPEQIRVATKGVCEDVAIPPEVIALFENLDEMERCAESDEDDMFNI